MKEGDIVEYIGCTEDQYRWASGKDPRKFFTVGQKLEVTYVEEHTWHTLLYFKGYHDGFNSVCFG